MSSTMSSRLSSQPVLIAGQWRAASRPAGEFAAVDPSSGAKRAETYPVSGMDDVAAALAAADQAVAALGASGAGLPEAIGTFLDDYAARIEGAADRLVEVAALETGLARAPRLR